MSDLISRKVVMDWLRELQAQSIINENHGTLVDATISTTVKHFIDFIVQVPTAYDVEKVVEVLEEDKNFWQSIGVTPIMNLEKAIKIVKGGGTE